MLNAGISANVKLRLLCIHILHVIQTQTIKLHIVQSLSFDLGWDLDLSLLAVLVGEAISPADTPRVSSIAAGALHADVLEHKVPSPLGHDLLCSQLRLLGVFFTLLLCCLRRESLLSELATLLKAQTRGQLAFRLHQFGMGNALVGREEAVVKSLAGVFTRESPGFRNRNPQLLACSRVYNQVVDGFVDDRSLAPVRGV